MSTISKDGHPHSQYSTKQKEMQDKLKDAAMCIGLRALMHPLQHVRYLQQLGYEPLPLRRGLPYCSFCKETLYLPNSFEFARHIYRTDGLAGLYRGVTSLVCGNVLGYYASLKAREYIDGAYPDYDETAKATKLQRLLQKTAKNSAVKCVAVVVSQPFQVVMIRAIAQRIGGESDYSRVFVGLSNADKQGGLEGLFAGLVPQLLFELCTMWTTAMLIHAIGELWQKANGSKEVDEETESGLSKNFKLVVDFVVPYFVNSLFYPLQVVGTLMAVNGCGLAAGMEPHLPHFECWTDCWSYLRSRKQTRRGGSMFFRSYAGATSWHMGHTYASMKHLDVASPVEFLSFDSSAAKRR